MAIEQTASEKQSSFDAVRGIGNNADGTDNWRGGWSWVGERGPELLNLPRGSQIMPNHKVLNQTQDIRQNVIPFRNNPISDLTQNVRQGIIPTSKEQPESLTQDIRQNLIPFKSNQATDLIQTVRQLMVPVIADQPEPLTQDIRQNVIPFDGYISKLNKGDRGQKVSENQYNGGGNTPSKGNKPSSVIINMYGTTIREEADIDKFANKLLLKIDETAANM